MVDSNNIESKENRKQEENINESTLIPNRNLQIPKGYIPPQTLDDYKHELQSLKSHLSFKEKELTELKDYTNTSFGIYVGVLFLTTFTNIDKYTIITLAIFGCLGVLSSNMGYTRKKYEIENSINRYEENIKTTKNKISREKKELKKKDD